MITMGQGGQVAAPRVDHSVVADLVNPGATVLDVGCGDGKLLSLLESTRNVDGRGIELSQEGVNASVTKGLSVVQGDADKDLFDYPDNAFDFVILSQTLQATHAPRTVLENLLRIGRHAIVSIPNFGHWRIRLRFLTRGRMPVTKDLPYSWYDTPNIHFCTISDFVALCSEVNADILQAIALDSKGQKVPFNAPWQVWNLIGQQGIFLLKNKS